MDSPPSMHSCVEVRNTKTKVIIIHKVPMLTLPFPLEKQNTCFQIATPNFDLVLLV
jgi:hypothetical protein